MAKNIGIQLNADYDLDIQVRRDAGTSTSLSDRKITAGLVVGDVTYQNQAMILKAQKGELKENPTVGVGIENMLNDHDFRLWKREITEQLEVDGQQIDRLVINEKEFILDAKYR